MYRTKFLISLCLLCCLTSVLQAQLGTSIAETYSLQEGLSDRSVRSIVKGRDSLIWIGTANGLNKFDGYNFTVFNSDPDDSLRLLHSNVQEIHRDADDRLLILYENITWKFNRFDPLTYELEEVEISPVTGVKGIVRDIEVDEHGEMFVLTFNGKDSTRVYHFDGEEYFQLLFSLYQPHNVPQNYQAILRHLSNGDFLINDSTIGLQLLDDQGNIKKYFRAGDLAGPEGPANFSYPNRVNILHEDEIGQVWVAWENDPGIFHLRFDEFSFSSVKGFDQAGYYTAIWEDKPGNLLIQQGSRAGRSPEVVNVFAYTQFGQVFNFSHLLDNPKVITSLFSEDFFKTIFLGTNDGFKVVRNNRFRIRTYLNQESREVNDNIVLKGIVGDNNAVYLAAESRHWYRLDLATDELDTLSFWDTRTGRQLDMHCGINLAKDADGFIWGAACENRLTSKLYKYDPEQCTVEDFDVPYPIRAFTIARDGLFWLGCSPSESNGILLIFDPDTGEYREFYLPDTYNPLQTAVPNYVFQSRDGLIWVGTGNGVYCIDPAKETYEHYHTDAKRPERLISHNSCLLIYEDEDGKIMLGTQNGLNIIDRENAQIKVLRRRDGLSNNTITGIIPDGKGRYWISTNNGISFYDPSDNSFRIFFQADGFSANAFNPFSFYRDEIGRFYFGSVNGLNVFLPKDLLLHEPKPTVLLTKIERYRSRDDTLMVMESNLHKVEQLVIEPYDTYFALHFTFPEFSRSEKNQYRMKLGNSQTWSPLYNDPVFSFHKLPAGNYTLLVEGADANGNRSAQPFVLPIKVKKHFYEKTWVLVLFILSIFSLIYWVFQSRMRQRLKMEQLRTKLASDLHDEVSGLLSGIAMQSDLVQFMVTDTKIQTRLKTIGEVSRKAMSKMSDVIWSIDSRKDQLEDLIGRMHEHADEMLLPLNIRYDIQVSHKMDRSQRLPANIRQDLYFIYKEAINNIAKHSNANRVFIGMKQSGNYFELSIQDNGTPVQELAPVHAQEGHSGKLTSISTSTGGAKKKSGQGLSNLKMRAERLKADLEINRNDGYAILLRMKKFL